MQVRVGTWCGGCAGEDPGTIQWAGGPTSFDAAPYIMTITSLEIDNANPAGSYIYGDMSGSASSIKFGGSVPLPQGNSTIDGTLNFSPVSTGSPSASSVASSSSSDPPTASTPTTTGAESDPTSAYQPVTTINVGPTSTHLASTDSEASKISMGGLAAVVIGAILLLAQY
jgi:hypothetical protein